MRISDRYIGKQVLWGTVFAVIVLSVILVLGGLFRQIRPLLEGIGQIQPSMIAQIGLNVLLFSMMFTIPWGFLSAVLLVFGRLSTDQELTGFRVAGISLPRLAAPVFVIALALCGVSTWLNVWVAPKAKASVTDMIQEELRRDPRSLLNPGVVQAAFRNQKVFVEAREGSALIGFHMYQIRRPGDVDGPSSAYIHAEKVDMLVDQPTQEFHLVLDGAYIETKNTEGTYQPAFVGQARYLPLSFQNSRPRKARPDNMNAREIRDFLDKNPKLFPKVRLAFGTEISKRYSYSMACLAFAFVGVPLALKSRRRDTSTGLILSMVIGASYFLSSFVADQFKTEAQMIAALWAPNVICVILGLILFRRARFR